MSYIYIYTTYFLVLIAASFSLGLDFQGCRWNGSKPPGHQWTFGLNPFRSNTFFQAHVCFLALSAWWAEFLGALPHATESVARQGAGSVGGLPCDGRFGGKGILDDPLRCGVGFVWLIWSDWSISWCSHWNGIRMVRRDSGTLFAVHEGMKSCPIKYRLFHEPYWKKWSL